MIIRNFFRIIIGAIFLFCCFPAFSIPYHVGDCTVDVEVRSSLLIMIPKARVRLWMQGKVIYIKGSASGYLSNTVTVPTSGAGGYYQRDVILEDVKKTFAAEDLNGKPLVSVYFQSGQYGFEPNEYGVVAVVPKNVWPVANSKKVDIFDSFWGIPLKQSCKIELVEDYYRIRMTVSRVDVDWSGAKFTVVFDTRKKVSSEKITYWLDKLAKVEANQKSLPAGAVDDLARFLFDNLSRPDVESVSNGKIPSSLKRLYDQTDKFSNLHQDVEEKRTSLLQ